MSIALDTNQFIPYHEQPNFWFGDLVNYYFSPNKKALITGMAYTSFIPYEEPKWHYHLESSDSKQWFQAWVCQEELILAHKNNPTDKSSYYNFST